MKNRKKYKLSTVLSTFPASSLAIPCLAATPNWCHFSKNIRLLQESILYPFLKRPLPCFSSVYPSKPAHSHLFEAFFNTPLLLQPAWSQPSNRVCIQIEVTTESQTKVGSVVLPCWPHLHLGAGRPGSSLQHVVCWLRCKMPSCPKQTSVPGKSSSLLHRDWGRGEGCKELAAHKAPISPQIISCITCARISNQNLLENGFSMLLSIYLILNPRITTHIQI